MPLTRLHPATRRHLTVLALLNALCVNSAWAQDPNATHRPKPTDAHAQETSTRPEVKRRFKHRRHAAMPSDDLFIARAVVPPSEASHQKSKRGSKKKP